MNAVLYCRYSSDSQREESIEGQIRECKVFAERNGINILNTYIDRAMSAKTDNRPQFQKMIADSHKRLFDAVLVWKLDRFARNRYDSARHKNTLKKNGVKVISATEQIAGDSTGILIESILEGYAEYYSAELSEKVIRGLKENALKAKYNGGGLPIGYIVDNEQRFHIDPTKAEIVRQTFQKYADGATIKGLVDWFNGQGVVSYRNRPMRIDCVKRLLHNRRYIGEYRYRDVVLEDAIPAIVDKPLFDRVQELLAKNHKAPARNKAVEENYLLTTKLFCGLCNSYMVGESGTGRGSKFHQYYKCVSVKKHRGCKKKTVRKAWIENLVVDETIKMLHDEAIFKSIVNAVMDVQKSENTTLPMLKKQLAEAERGIENVLNAIQQGILTPSTKQRLDALEESKSKLETAILQEEMEKPVLTREQVIFFLQRYRKTDITKQDERQRLIDTFISAIYLYDDKIVFTFNYKDGTKTINIDDVKQAFGSDLSASGAPRPHGLHTLPRREETLWGKFVSSFVLFPMKARFAPPP